MSGVMVKVALYGLIRVLFEWAAPVPLWVGLALLALGLLSALGGVLYALVQRDLKRLLAFSTIENVGIVALGLGASLVFAPAGRPHLGGARLRRGAAAHPQPRALQGLLFLAAGAFERAVGSLDLDRLGGLLRRMPWTGGAFLLGATAIAGVPPLNGFASEWLTLQALVHVGLRALARHRAGRRDRRRRAGRDGGARRSTASSRRSGWCCSGAPRTARGRGGARGPARDARRRRSCSPRCCVALGAVPGLLLPALAELAPGARRSSPPSRACTSPAPARCPRPGCWLGIVALTALAWRLRGAPPRRAGAGLGLRPAGRASAALDLGRASPSRCASCSRACCARAARSRSRARAAWSRRSTTAARSRTSSTPPLPAAARARPRRRRGSRGGCSRAASAPTPPTCWPCCWCCCVLVRVGAIG